MKKTKTILAVLATALAATFSFIACDGNAGTGEAGSMTVKLIFDDFTADSVSVMYGDKQNKDNSEKATTVEPTLAADKKSASFEASETYAHDNYMNVFELTAKDSENNAVAVVVKSIEASYPDADTGKESNNTWFVFSDGGTATITYRKQTDSEKAAAEAATSISGTKIWSGDVTLTGSFAVACASSNFEDKELKKLTVIVADGKYTGSEENLDWWVNISYADDWNTDVKLKNADCWNDALNGYKYETADTTFISGVKTNGLMVAGLNDLKYTITVYYE